MPASPDISARLAALISSQGPISIERFMAEANAHYYSTRDPFGAAGDFITAPEVSQMFGELVGLSLADVWHRVGRPEAAYVELGPGRGTLAADALRAMKVAGLVPPVHFVETSPLLRDSQRQRVPGASWHEAIDTLPVDRPLLIVANEFFDALPVSQFVKTDAGWRERLVTHRAEGFEFICGMERCDEAINPALGTVPIGSVVEQGKVARSLAGQLAQRLAEQGGVLVALDYGYRRAAPGDTLQAVRAHAYADPLIHPGSSDLTTHVDFGALAEAAKQKGARVAGPIDQGQWLIALGLSDRAAALARGAPARAEEIAAAYRRLTRPEEMGRLFKAIAFHADDWPAPAGFA